MYDMMRLWAISQYESASSMMERKDPHRKQAKGRDAVRAVIVIPWQDQVGLLPQDIQRTRPIVRTVIARFELHGVDE